MKKFYIWLIFLCTFSIGLHAQQSLAASGACAQIPVTGVATLGIQVTGTWATTLQGEVSIGGNSFVNIQVTPSTSSTAQSTITASGAYIASVAGYDVFQLCFTSYSSGTATVYYRPTSLVNASLLGGGGGSVTFAGDLSGSSTSQTVVGVEGAAIPTSAAFLGTNSSKQLISVSSPGTVANCSTVGAFFYAASTGTTATCDANLTDASNTLTYTPGALVLGNATTMGSLKLFATDGSNVIFGNAGGSVASLTGGFNITGSIQLGTSGGGFIQLENPLYIAGNGGYGTLGCPLVSGGGGAGVLDSWNCSPTMTSPTMTTQAATDNSTKGATTAYVQRLFLFNQSTATQSVGSGGNTVYATNSNILVAANTVRAGTIITDRMTLQKTAAGTAASSIVIYVGPNATTGDTAAVTQSMSTETGAADVAWVDIMLTSNAASATCTTTCTVQYSMKITHNSANGVGLGNSQVVQGTFTFDSTANTYFGMGVISGASDVLTIDQVTAQAQSL